MIPDEAVGHVMSALRGHLELTTAEAETIAKSVLETAAPYIKAQAMDKAVEDAEGLGMDEVPVHSLRFRAECYRNIGANLYGGKA